MKEININIEGYNVNGICVGCLNYNRKMFYDDDVKECFKLIGNIDVPDGLTVQVCWECLAAVKNVIKFRHQVLNSYDVLIGYSQQHTFLDSPEDFTQHATTRLASVCLESVDTTVESDNNQNTDFEIKYELKLEDASEPGALVDLDPDPVKDEIDFPEDSQFSDDFQSQDQDLKNSSSDEDIKLSKLQKRKHKKRRKNKKDEIEEEIKTEPTKPSRKLKNLPSDIVQLYTMTEEEMWNVRARDVECEHFGKLRYKCTDCILGFNTEKLRDYHRNSKHKPIKMFDCILEFNTEKLRDYHRNSKHKPKSASAYKCDVCKAYFLTKDNLTTHRSLHLTAYKCRVCELTTTMKRMMLRHACATNGAAQYKCNHCDKLFSTISKLNYHKNVCHQEKPQCDCCGKVFANKMTLKYHLKILPQNKEEKPKEKLYIKCEGCNKVFHSKKSYRAHVVIHEGLTYPCPICGKLFQWKRNLSRHTRAHRERDAGALHECRECGKTFSSRDCYNNHMRLSKRHASPNTYVHECNYCGKKFPTKWCMVDHIDWEHLKRVKYQCTVCFKPFKTAKIMVAHMNNIHEGKKREAEGEHLCDICGKSYKTVKRLKGHVWAMHTQRSNTKNYKCKLCAATFLWQTSIYKHVRMMHDNTRTKPSRTTTAMKKQDPYSDLELANRMYFHQNVNNITQSMPTHPVAGNGL